MKEKEPHVCVRMRALICMTIEWASLSLMLEVGEFRLYIVRPYTKGWVGSINYD